MQMRLTAYDKKTGAYVDSLTTDNDVYASEFIADFQEFAGCRVEVEE